MNKIKGLILKDILQIKTYMKSFIIFLIICLISAFSCEGPNEIATSITVFIPIGFGIFCLASFSYDEMSKADRYILCMPFSKNEIILAKYLLMIVSIVLGSLLGVVLSCILSYVMVQELPTYTDLISLAIGAVFGVGLVECVQMPLIYKFGMEKGRVWIFIIVFGSAFLFGAIANLFDSQRLTEIISFLKQRYLLSIGVQIFVIAMMFFISYKISCEIYNKKDI